MQSDKKHIIFDFSSKQIKHRRITGILPKELLIYHKHPETNKIYLKKFHKVFNLLFFCVIALAVISGLYYVFVKSVLFKITDIRIEGTKVYVNSDDLNHLIVNQVYGRSIVFLDTEALKTILLKTFLGAKDISVSKIFPKILKISVSERTPIAILQTVRTGEMYLIDTEGYVLGQVEEGKQELPKIQYGGDVKISNFIDKKLIPIYGELVLALRNDNVLASSISFSPDFVSLTVGDSVRVLIGNDKDKKKAVDAVAQILRQLSLEGKKVTKIDLRYDKVIVSYD